MIILNNTNIFLFFINFLFPFVRVLALISMLPIFDNNFISYRIKILLSVIITILLIPFLPKLEIVSLSFINLLILSEQILIGMVLGMMVQFILTIGSITGDIIGLQIGLSFSTIFDSSSHINRSIISRFFYVLIILLLISWNSHIWIILILVNTFYTIPIEKIVLTSGVFLDIVKFYGIVFMNGMMLSIPIIIFILTLNIIMGVLNRILSQLSIFSVGFPVTLLTGLFILNLLIFIISPHIKDISQFLMLSFIVFLKEFSSS
ncbi:flagellar biosynthetic protein FliR [Buchnera aphidicola]|uniref:flagellar biosynthetic protein FliR n=1 Tax=Buchnera aphidicola TaxID=9 RepID=UPI0034639F4F